MLKCATFVSQTPRNFFLQNQKNILYPSLSSAIRPVVYPNELPIPKPPVTLLEPQEGSTENSCVIEFEDKQKVSDGH